MHPCDRPPPRPLREGARLFNTRQFFLCHEVLEHRWVKESGATRLLYQGIIQLSVACYHLVRGNYAGAVGLLPQAMAKLEPFRPRCLGLDVDRLAADARALLGHVEELGRERVAEYDIHRLPTIALGAARRPRARRSGISPPL